MPGTGRPSRSVTLAVSPTAKISGRPGTLRSGIDLDASGAIMLGVDPVRRRRGDDARSPDHRRRLDAAAVVQRHAPRVAAGHHAAELDLDAHALQRARGIVRQRLGESAAAAAGRLRSGRCASVRGSIRRKSCCKVRRATSAIAPAISTPVAPPPTMTKVSRPLPLGRRLRPPRRARRRSGSAAGSRSRRRCA